MQNIMVVLLEESEDVREDLLYILLSTLGRDKRDVTAAARKLSVNVIQQCMEKLEPSIKQLLLSLMSGDSKPVDCQVQYHEVIYDLYCCAPQILSGVLPYVMGELLTDQLETRMKAVNLVGDIIALPETSIAEAFQPILSEFLKRLTDSDDGVRMSVLDHVKSSLLSNPHRAEAPQMFSALCDRLLDFDENVRKQVVAVICDVACHSLHAVPLEAVKLVAEWVHDKPQLVKMYTVERLAEIYRVFCEKSSDNVDPVEYNWIPGKILRCFYDEDFRSDTIESVLCGSLFPSDFSIHDMVKHWVEIFSGIDKVEVKALEKILGQKQRLQEEMQKYLVLRQNSQDKDNPEVQKKITSSFRVMSRSFADPTKAEESFQILDQLKDDNIWKFLKNLVDPNTSFHQTHAYKDDLIKLLGEKHQLYEFLNTLCLKCSNSLFNKEHVTAVLSEIISHKSAENDQRIESCMKILVVILSRTEPPLGREAVYQMLDMKSNVWSMMRKGIVNYNRIMSFIGGFIAFWKWLEDIRYWKNPTTTLLFHFLCILVLLYPEIIMPFMCCYFFWIGLKDYFKRLKHPCDIDATLSGADTTTPEDLEELDVFPTEAREESLRTRFDRLRETDGKIHRLANNIATIGEKVQYLSCWRDPRATLLFLLFCVGGIFVALKVPVKAIIFTMMAFYLRHPKFRYITPMVAENIFDRIPSKEAFML